MSVLSAIKRVERLAGRVKPDAARDAAARYRGRAGRYDGRAADYARDVLRVTLTPQQVKILELLDTPPYRVLVRSANNQGKTFLAAVAASHRYDQYDPGLTLCTAPTFDQVRDLLFKELRTLRDRAGAPNEFLPKATRLESSFAHFVHGFTAATADGFQGRHADRMLIVFDEATGVDRSFWDRARTMFQPRPGHGWLAIYNPNDVSSPAYEAEESGQWHVVGLSALDHPNVLAELRGEPPPIPSAVTLATVVERIALECRPVRPDEVDPATDFEFPAGSGAWHRPERPEFEAQVLGRWPVTPLATLFSPALVDRCRRNVIPEHADWPLQIGCDVARFGEDKTAIALRRGPCLLYAETMARQDTKAIADRIAEVAYHAAGSTEAAKLVPVVVDGTGGYGGGVVDRLGGYRVTELSMSQESPDPRILRMRSYLWFRLREFAEAGLLDLSRLPDRLYADLRADLVAPKYKVDELGRKVLEPKSQIKTRLNRSPDVADAVALAYYTG